MMTGGGMSASSSASSGPSYSGAGSVTVGGFNPPTWLGGDGAGIPPWVWLAGAALLAVALVGKRRR